MLTNIVKNSSLLRAFFGDFV